MRPALRRLNFRKLGPTAKLKHLERMICSSKKAYFNRQWLEHELFASAVHEPERVRDIINAFFGSVRELMDARAKIVMKYTATTLRSIMNQSVSSPQFQVFKARIPPPAYQFTTNLANLSKP